MADNQSTIALDIGTQHVSLAVFNASKSGGLTLNFYDTEAISADPSTESVRMAQIGQAVSALVSRAGVKGKARYAISGQASLIRFVKLPSLGGDNLDELVRMEAQQQIPFPLDEVVWDYEVLDSSGETEVVIVAVKREILDEINDAVNDAGLGTAEVDVAPMALYNAFLASNPNLDGPALLIDVGAKTSDLLYIDGNHFFTRSANVGGASITAAIAKQFNVTFAEAEVHKTRSGMVALGGGHTSQLDETTAALATCIRNAMTRLATEIPRTTNYYRSQHGGNAPERVFLAGGGANLPYAKEFLEEKLRLPVEYFNPLRSIAVGSKVDTGRLSKEAHTMGELIGLGLRGAGRSKLNIDLVPAKVGEARVAEKRRPFYLAAAALLVLGAAAAGLSRAKAAKLAETEADNAQRQLEQLQAPAGQIQTLVAKRDQLSSIAQEYVQADEARVFWLDAFRELSETFASDSIWLVDFNPVVNYNAFDAKSHGDIVIKDDFATASSSGSSLMDRKTLVAAQGRQRRGEPSEVEVPAEINAVRIKGFWLNKKGVTANIVFDLLDKLGANIKEGNSHFTYTMKNAETGEEKELEKKQLAPSVTANPAEGEFAAPFELILPLREPVSYR